MKLDLLCLPKWEDDLKATGPEPVGLGLLCAQLKTDDWQLKADLAGVLLALGQHHTPQKNHPDKVDNIYHGRNVLLSTFLHRLM